MSIRHIHSSSRYDRSVESLTRAARDYNQHADIVTYTEVDFERRERAVKKANGNVFGFVSGDKSHANDSAIAYRKERFKLLYFENFRNASRVVHRKTGQARDLPYTTIAVLEDRHNGKRLVLGVAHLASSVEGALRTKRPYGRSIQWGQSFRSSIRRINRLARRFKTKGRMFVADFNVDFKKRWVRALIKSIAPRYAHTWKNTRFAGGTHGRRVIDATLLRGMRSRGSARLYKDDASSDHRPYKEVLIW